MGCARVCNVLHGLKPMLIMVMAMTVSAGMNVILKLVAIDGMTLTVFTAYRVMFASGFMIPLALIVERNRRPKLTWTILAQAFLCGLFGISLAQNLYALSVALISATFTVAITNLIPAFTFILAICFRLEQLAPTSIQGILKLSGTAVGMGGAMLFIFYKGLTVNIWSVHTHLMVVHNNNAHGQHQSTLSSNPRHPSNYAFGSGVAILSCLCSSLWLIIQGKMSKTYPCPMSTTALISLMATIQSVIFALCMEKDWSQWKLGWNIRLLGVAYSGILASGIAGTLTSWCINMRGPLFVASFTPILLVLVAVFGSLLLEEQLYLGSILGAVLIICGLYLVLWGKSIEMKKMNRVEPVLQTPRPSEFQSVEIVTSPTAVNSESNNNVIRST